MIRVIKLKDIMQYLVKIIIVFTIFYLARYFYLNFYKANKFNFNIGNSNQFIFIDNVLHIKKYTKDEKTFFDMKKNLNISSILNSQLEYKKMIANTDLVINKDEITKDDIDELEEYKEIISKDDIINIDEIIKVNKVENIDETIKNIENKITDIQFKNESDITLTEDMLIPNVKINNLKDILIFHTHTSESYTSTEKNYYEPSGNFRTTDLNYSVAKVGEELGNYLKNNNFNVIHNKTFHDFPAYSGSYSRSYETVEKILKDNQEKNIEMVFDIHRDAIGNSNYAPIVKINEEDVAQIMFVIGTNGGGAWHNNWINNFKIAIKIQELADEMYPGLFRPLILRNSRYNQNLANGAVILEVGATGNTLEQANLSMKYFGEILKNLK